MNDIFSLKRFSLSFRRLMVEKGIKMFGSILVILFIIILFMNIQVNPGTYTNIQSIFLILGLMFGPVLYMAVVANEFTEQSKGISYLLMPSSTFEKWFLNNVVVISLYYIVFGSLFRLIDLWMIGRIEAKFNIPKGNILPVYFDSEIFIIAALVGAGISLGILLGSHYFKKNSLIISLVIMFGLLLVVFLSDHFFANVLFDGMVIFGDSAPFGSVAVTDPASASGRYFLEIPLTPKQTIALVFLPVIAILSLTYFVRIKEKEL